MAWYNTYLSEETCKKFYLSSGGPLSSISECYSGEESRIPGLNPYNPGCVNDLENRIGAAWKFFESLREILDNKGITISANKSHLKERGKNINPYYTACIYVQIGQGYEYYDILNLSIVANDVNIEIRHPKSELFSITDCEKRINDEYMLNPPPDLGYINDNPMFSVRKFLSIEENSLDNSFFIEPESFLMKEVVNYVMAVSAFIGAGNRLRTFGESKAEKIIYGDLAYIFSNEMPVLSHGQRPVDIEGRNRNLELDIQISLPEDVSIAIEVQGPDHYIDGRNRGNLWEDVNQKHIDKIIWCQANNRIFVWLDWAAYNRLVFKNGSKPRKADERLKLTRHFMDHVISLYNKGCRFVAITDKEDLEFVPMPDDQLGLTFTTQIEKIGVEMGP